MSPLEFVRDLRAGLRLTLRAASLAAALALASGSVLAEPVVSGTPAAVRIDAQNASIDEIMTALSSAFGLDYSSSAKLDTHLSGTYEGSLRRVVARLLEGNNFVVRTSSGKLQVTVFAPGQQGPRTAVAAASSPAPAAKSATPATPAPTKIAQPEAKPGPAPAKAATASGTGPQPTADIPMPLASPNANTPPVRLAEGPSPMLPTPVQGSGPGMMPTLVPSSMAPPMPVVSSDLKGPMPEIQPSSAMPPMPESMMPKPADGGPPAPSAPTTVAPTADVPQPK